MPRKTGPNIAKGKFDYAKQLRLDLEYAKRCITKEGHLMPLFVVHAAHRVTPIGVGGMNNYDDKEKRGHREMARLICIADNGFAVAFIGEAWIASSKPGEPDPEYPEVMPSQREDRQEVVIAQIIWRNDDTGERLTAVAQAEVVRNAKGKCTGVKDEKTSDPQSFIMGSFAEVLPEREPTFEERDAAQQILKAALEQGAAKKVDIR
jgi:hypothetical protein